MNTQLHSSFGKVPRHIIFEMLDWPHGCAARYLRVFIDPLYGVSQ